MPLTLERSWRIIATAFCFSVFGLGGLVILCGVLPLLRLSPNTRRAQLRARALIHHSFRAFVRLMIVCGVISVETRHLERLQRPEGEGMLIVANHPSLIDVVLLIALVRNPNCIVKASLRENIFTRGPILGAGFIANDDGTGLLETCIASVRAGDALIVFPEGTRNRGGEPGRFQRGALHAALRGQLALTPIVIRVSEPMLSKGQGWYHAPRRKPHFILDIQEDRACATPGQTSASVRRLAHELRDFFVKELEQHG